MNTRPSTAARPDFVSTINAWMVSSRSITTPAPKAWNRMSTPRCEQEFVGSALVGRGVVGLRLDLAEDEMRLVQPA